MNEQKIKNLTLFILETLILQTPRNITKTYAYFFNEFIYKCYEEHQEFLVLIYDTNLLEEFIKNNYELLSLNQIQSLIKEYPIFDGYIKLLDEVGLDTANKLNQLALLFIQFQQETYNLYYDNSNKCCNKGFAKILQ